MERKRRSPAYLLTPQQNDYVQLTKSPSHASFTSRRAPSARYETPPPACSRFDARWSASNAAPAVLQVTPRPVRRIRRTARAGRRRRVPSRPPRPLPPAAQTARPAHVFSYGFLYNHKAPPIPRRRSAWARKRTYDSSIKNRKMTSLAHRTEQCRPSIVPLFLLCLPTIGGPSPTSRPSPRSNPTAQR